MDKEKNKKSVEQTPETKESLVQKDDNKQEVPEYVGPKFYGSDHPRKTEEDKSISSNQSLQELIEKNIKWSQVIYNQNKKIKRRLTMLVIGNYLRLFLILAPIILGILYFPEILAKTNEYFGQYLNIDVGGTKLNLLDLINNNSTTNIDASQLQKLLQKN